MRVFVVSTLTYKVSGDKDGGGGSDLVKWSDGDFMWINLVVANTPAIPALEGVHMSVSFF